MDLELRLQSTELDKITEVWDCAPFAIFAVHSNPLDVIQDLDSHIAPLELVRGGLHQ